MPKLLWFSECYLFCPSPFQLPTSPFPEVVQSCGRGDRGPPGGASFLLSVQFSTLNWTVQHGHFFLSFRFIHSPVEPQFYQKLGCKPDAFHISFLDFTKRFMGLIIPFLNENVMQRKQNMDMSVSEYVIFENLFKEFALFKKKSCIIRILLASSGLARQSENKRFRLLKKCTLEFH